MKWIRIGKVGRAHGFRGTFVVQEHAGEDSALSSAGQIRVGTQPYAVESAKLAQQGWLLKLAGADSEDWVRLHLHAELFVSRDQLPPPEPGEYYETDLVGFAAVDAETGERLGTFTGSEPQPVGPDRWWFREGDRELAVPAVERYVESVDEKARVIRVRNRGELP